MDLLETALTIAGSTAVGAAGSRGKDIWAYLTGLGERRDKAAERQAKAAEAARADARQERVNERDEYRAIVASMREDRAADRKEIEDIRGRVGVLELLVVQYADYTGYLQEKLTAEHIPFRPFAPKGIHELSGDHPALKGAP